MSSFMAPGRAASRTRSTAQYPLTAGMQGERVRLQQHLTSINVADVPSPPTPAPSPQPFMPESTTSPDSTNSNGATIIVHCAPTPQNLTADAIAWSSLASTHLRNLPSSAIDSLLISTLPHLTSAQLMHFASLLPARLKRDFIADLPPEVSLHILSFVDDVKTLARASRVSRTWRTLVNDEAPWKMMCVRRGFELQAEDERTSAHAGVRTRKTRLTNASEVHPSALASVMGLWSGSSLDEHLPGRHSGSSRKGKQRARRSIIPFQLSTSQSASYRKHFKTAHLTESNWRHSGRLLRSHRSQDAGVVTSLAMDDQWIVVGLANSRVHVFSASTGVLARTLIGHEAGVWSLCLVSKGGGAKTSRGNPTPAEEPETMLVHREEDSWASVIPPSLQTRIGLGTSASVASSSSTSSSSSSSSGDMPFQSVFDSLRPSPGESGGTAAEDGDPSACQSDPCNASRGWGQANALVVSCGCDKQVRVWDIKSGYCLYVLRGHRSTVRCLKVFHGRPVAVSGGRDHTLRVWDIQKGTLLRTLEGHTDSVRCLDVYGNKVVSGSYDCAVRLWDVDTGECLRVFNGHYHQVYTVAFDGERIASGGLDTTVRIWSARTGACLALLQGHTALVCQLQLSSRTNTVITGSADGRIIIFGIAPATTNSRSSTPIHSIPIAASPNSDVLASPPLSPPMPAIDAGDEHDTQGSDASGYRILTRVPAHTSSVTGLQFDDRPGRRWIVSGGTDGRVQLWEFDERSGSASSGMQGSDVEMKLVRDLTEPCEGLWKVAFRGDMAVICCLRAGRTVLEIWSFRPVEEDL